MLFGRRDYGKIISSTHAEIKELDDKIGALSQEIAPIVEDRDSVITEEIEVMATSSSATLGSQTFQNIVLSVSSVIGTLAWAFGDWAAKGMWHYHFLVH